MAQSARVQLRSLPSDGGLDLLHMSEVAIPAFYAARLGHFRQLLQEGVPGPYLSPLLQHTASSSLFSESFHQAQAAFEPRKAVPVQAETDIHPTFIIPEWFVHISAYSRKPMLHLQLQEFLKYCPRLPTKSILLRGIEKLAQFVRNVFDSVKLIPPLTHA